MSTTNCIGVTSGAIYVSGGINIAKDMRIGGNININGDVIKNGNVIISSRWNYIESDDNLIWFGSHGNYHVGINTTTPSFNLDVNGSIRSTSITTGILCVDTNAIITNINATTITLGTLISNIIDVEQINIKSGIINEQSGMLYLKSVDTLPVCVPNGINSGYLFNKNVTINPVYITPVTNLNSYGMYILSFAYWGINDTPSDLFSSWYVTYGDGYIKVTNLNENQYITLSNSAGNLIFRLNGLIGNTLYNYNKFSCAYTKLVTF